MQAIEWTAALAGLICVWLTIRQNVWCWPIGLVQVVLFVFVFYQARLYSDVVLHVIYIFLQFYGWYYWLYGGRERDELPVTRSSLPQAVAWCATVVGGTGLWGLAMATWTDAASPFVDAFIAVASLVAQWLLARKKLESWYFWIVVDVVGIGLFYQRELYPTAGLYAVFLGLATYGCLQWRKSMRSDANSELLAEGKTS